MGDDPSLNDEPAVSDKPSVGDEASAPRWVDRLVVEAVQLDLIREHGGMPGLRDEHALESALARPRQRHAYEPASTLPELAASYAYGLARSHPFHDGNKRIAFVTMAVFLGLNGLDLDAPEPEVVAAMVALAAGEIDEAGLAAWVGSRVMLRRTPECDE
ncbi:MAG: type II toxin-antitoxin system death-on-curing family toxin [Thermoleophilia bacterium]|nr:type II toxin-antitoxin system death-on-curing family toxin [Thermoleophilia bacterium]